MTEYDPARHWSQVADQIRERSRGREVAGDDAPYFHYKRRLLLERFLSALPVEHRSVLEVGCGPGGNLRELASRRPARLAGCDLAPGMVELARDAVAGLGVDVRLSDGSTLPFPDREFDTSFTVTVLQHNGDERGGALAAEMARVTVSSIYLIEDTVEEALPIAAGRGDAGGVGDYENFYPRTVAGFARLFRSQGFELTRAVRLQTRVSHRAFALFQRLFDRGRRGEGEPYSRAHVLAGRMTLPFTSVLDRHAAPLNGELTMMVLARR